MFYDLLHSDDLVNATLAGPETELVLIHTSFVSIK